MTTVQLPFAFLAVCGLVSTHFAAVPALSLEHSITLHRSFSPALLLLLLFMSLWISEMLLHSLSKSGLEDFNLSKINLAYDVS
jgi:hypothetical protein